MGSLPGRGAHAAGRVGDARGDRLLVFWDLSNFASKEGQPDGLRQTHGQPERKADAAQSVPPVFALHSLDSCEFQLRFPAIVAAFYHGALTGQSPPAEA